MNSWSDRTKALVLFGLTLLVYGFGINRDFIFDDLVYISQNPLLGRPDALRLFWFTADTFNYYPLFWSLLHLQWLAWGDHPLGYHAVTLLVHGVNVILLWRILRACRVGGAGWIAALFAVHPVNVQTIAWAAEQKNTWSFLFMALAFIAFIKHAEKDDWRCYGISFVCFLAALACKTSTVCLPIFLAIYYGFRRETGARRILLRLFPFFIGGIAAGITTMWFEQHRVGAKSLIGTLNLWQRMEAAGAAFWFYLEKAIVPIDLTPMYRGWADTTVATHTVIPGLLLVLLLAACALSWRRISAPVALGITYYALMLLPLLGVFDTNYFIYSQIADHWQYHALPGLLVALVSAARSLRERIPLFARYSKLAGVLVVAITALLASAHFAHFENARTLWTYVIKQNPDAWIAWYNLGNDHFDNHEYSEAIAAYHESIRLRPGYYQSNFNLANTLAAANRFGEADRAYLEAEKISPTDSDAFVNRAVLHLRMGRNDEAVQELRHALELQPHKASAEANLARIERNLSLSPR